MKFLKKLKKNKWNQEVAPDEIFLDSKNLPEFNVQQMEGRIEKPISKKTLVFSGIFFILIGIIFSTQVGILQIARGESYSILAEKNSLDKELIFADRGIIYDRNKIPLAFNVLSEKNSFADRSYFKDPGFGHLLGYLGYPTKDKAGFYWQKEFVGKDGLEKFYNDRLNGKNGVKIFETDALGEIQSENTIVPPVPGENLYLSIDSRVQSKLYGLIESFALDYKFEGGSGAIMDIRNGEILALNNFPEYSPDILTSGDSDTIGEYINDKRKPFLNRAVQGLYTPGSIVKPIVALAALNEKIINPTKKILSIGYIEIPNPYFPDKKSVFNDWKAHGWVDMREALAQSSDVYFYEIGGGFEGQRGLGIGNIEKYTKMFGVGSETGIDLPGENTGVIPTPAWKQIHFPNDSWRIGDTYNTSIGQYGFQVTPLEMLRATGAIANYGELLRLHVLREEEAGAESAESRIDMPEEYFNVVHKGMRLAVTAGTASRLNIPFVKVSAKTGTAQVGVSKDRVNSWVIGFFPSDKPRYAFTVLMENGPASNSTSASLIMSQLLSWMNENTPEYFEA